MARRKKRDSLDDALSELSRATRDIDSAEASTALRHALESGESFVAARAAQLVAEHHLEGFEGALIDALDRFLEGDPIARDPGCHAKVAIVEAMDATDVRSVSPFERAARHVQKEPAWGQPVDTAAPVRARAVLALGRGGYSDLLVLAGEAIADPEPPVRRAALCALAAHGDRLGAGLARFKVALGDEDPLVLSEAMGALLTLAPDVGVLVLAERLDDEDLGVRELAAIALGESRRADALDVLLGRMGRLVRASDRAPYFTALALHRSEPALRALLAFLEGPRPTAIAALEALAIRRFEAEVVERVEPLARAAGLADAFAESFGDRA